MKTLKEFIGEDIGDGIPNFRMNNLDLQWVINAYLETGVWVETSKKGPAALKMVDWDSRKAVTKRVIKFLVDALPYLKASITDDTKEKFFWTEVGKHLMFSHMGIGTDFTDAVNTYGRENAMKLYRIAMRVGPMAVYVGTDGKVYFD